MTATTEYDVMLPLKAKAMVPNDFAMINLTLWGRIHNTLFSS